jgi:hypothetical protein
MTNTFRLIQAKVTRAKQHIQDLQFALSAFNDTKPYVVSIKENLEAGKRICYVAKADPVPDSIATIAADVIQNLRSPLDQIAYQLVLDARGGAEPDWFVYYPICGNATDYPSLRNRFIKGVRQEVVDAIDATEPYKCGKGHAIWQLNALNKPDKHKLLVGAGSFSSGVEITQTFSILLKNMPGFENISLPAVFLTPADKLLDHEVAEDRRFTFDVSFNEPSVIECEPALKTLQDMTNLVDGIIGTLGRFLP